VLIPVVSSYINKSLVFVKARLRTKLGKENADLLFDIVESVAHGVVEQFQQSLWNKYGKDKDEQKKELIKDTLKHNGLDKHIKDKDIDKLYEGFKKRKQKKG